MLVITPSTDPVWDWPSVATGQSGNAGCATAGCALLCRRRRRGEGAGRCGGSPAAMRGLLGYNMACQPRHRQRFQFRPVHDYLLHAHRAVAVSHGADILAAVEVSGSLGPCAGGMRDDTIDGQILGSTGWKALRNCLRSLVGGLQSRRLLVRHHPVAGMPFGDRFVDFEVWANAFKQSRVMTLVTPARSGDRPAQF